MREDLTPSPAIMLSKNSETVSLWIVLHFTCVYVFKFTNFLATASICKLQPWPPSGWDWEALLFIYEKNKRIIIMPCIICVGLKLTHTKSDQEWQWRM